MEVEEEAAAVDADAGGVTALGSDSGEFDLLSLMEEPALVASNNTHLEKQLSSEERVQYHAYQAEVEACSKYPRADE